jgi:3-isopropylmalate/(R)-2-methylmalate dehydratase large subunit
MAQPRTIIDKIWDEHVVHTSPDGTELLYVDLHLVHEATSAQAFDGLSLAGRTVRRRDLTLAVEDHNVPTDNLLIREPMSRAQVETLRSNCARHGIQHLPLGDPWQGIVHVIAPELGLVQPGMSVVCGDSHTATHGAFGALAFGVGTSDVEHVLATQTLQLPRPRTMAVELTGSPRPDVEPKDLIMALIAQLGANGAHGHVLEYRGPALREISMEGRMSICNMTAEAGARAGLIAPDETTHNYLSGRPFAPKGDEWDAATAWWRDLRTDPGARFDQTVELDVSAVTPFVTWGTNPGQAVPLGDGVAPDPDTLPDPDERAAARRALDYMGIVPGTRLREIEIDTVFLGSCTNGRIEDLRTAARVLAGRRIAPGVRMLVVPGSMQVRQQAEAEGLHEIFRTAGAEWRLAGCSMCLGMNTDRLQGEARVASTSNRNYERRQGDHARTHLVSPSTAAATAVAGHLAAPSDLAAGA